MRPIQVMRNGGGSTGGSTDKFIDLVYAANPVMWWGFEEFTGTSTRGRGSAGIGGTLRGGASFATASVAAPSGLAGLGRGVDMAVASAQDIIAASGMTGAALTATGGGSATSSWTIVLTVAGGSGSGYLASRGNDFAVIHNFVAGKVEFFALGYTGTNPRTGSQIDLSDSDTTTPHQIAYRYDNGTWSGFLDGTQVFSVAASFALAASATTFLAASDGGSSLADRKFWDLQTYDRALSNAELAAQWAARNNAPSSATFNAADKAAAASLSESDKRMTRTAGLDQWAAARTLTGHDAGDAGGFYAEFEIVGGDGSSNMVGIGKSTASLAAGAYTGSDANGWAYYGNGTKLNAGASTAYGGAYTLGDIVGVLIKNGKLYFRLNGTWIGDPVAETGFAFSGITGTVFLMPACYTGGTSSVRLISRVGSLPAGAADWG